MAKAIGWVYNILCNLCEYDKKSFASLETFVSIGPLRLRMSNQSHEEKITSVVKFSCRRCVDSRGRHKPQVTEVFAKSTC